MTAMIPKVSTSAWAAIVLSAVWNKRLRRYHLSFAQIVRADGKQPAQLYRVLRVRHGATIPPWNLRNRQLQSRKFYKKSMIL